MNSTKGTAEEQGIASGQRAGRSAIALADPTLPGEVVPFRVRKNPAAVSLGRLGGLKGGKARAASLTPAQRAEIARKGGMTAAANRKTRQNAAK